jgi:GT2 family glycosyltransferase
MSCDIIIPVWNEYKLTRECVESIERATRYPHRLILIDNASADETAGYLRSLAVTLGARVIRNEENIGFIKAVNQGLAASRAPYVCVMNNDTIAARGWLSEMAAVAGSDSAIGNNLGQGTGGKGVDECADGLKSFAGEYVELGSAVGFCMLIKRPLIEKIGYLDEAYGDGNFDDTDYSRRAQKAGYTYVRAKGAYVYHHMNTSFLRVKSREGSFRKNRLVYESRWGRIERVLYILTKRDDRLSGRIGGEALEKARGGNWVWFFLPRGLAMPRMREHSNVKAIGLPDKLFGWNCLYRILKKKKRFHSIYSDDPGILRNIDRLRILHGAKTQLIGG